MTLRSLTLLVLALSAPAQAADPVVESDHGIDCTHPIGTMDTDLCLSDAFSRADQLLNDAYRQLLPRLDAQRRDGACSQCTSAQLVDAQRRWIAFRDADCGLAYAIAADGSGRNQARLDCMIDHTDSRTRRLRALDSEL
ncbi:lysozyme inhibitor LprI family protein [Luteimonas terrae]|uniref:Uncharacterized protein YecT (DUF1311 family) n=1 Tax=Luteimonas terrae TaxID=1530191 RepID=A0ABU1XUB2_9GAMM|nr:lysozyme inhibitor LprI family protein [Luteimonas terrae]MDR7192348.1 uncharacterized protein YecT (DUF1311 family) [Luteimonas terrae]